MPLLQDTGLWWLGKCHSGKTLMEEKVPSLAIQNNTTNYLSQLFHEKCLVTSVSLLTSIGLPEERAGVARLGPLAFASRDRSLNLVR